MTKIGEFRKNAVEKLQASIDDFKGKKVFDLRVYYETLEGEWKPTKKGITISINKINDIVDLINQSTKIIKQLEIRNEKIKKNNI